jgi:hypothetical protein
MPPQLLVTGGNGALGAHDVRNVGPSRRDHQTCSGSSTVWAGRETNLRTATTTKHAGHQASDPRRLRTTTNPGDFNTVT